jgi:hypothetical protein
MSIFIINLIKNIPELLTPLLKKYLKKQLKEVDETLIVHPYNKIDSFIDE